MTNAEAIPILVININLMEAGDFTLRMDDSIGFIISNIGRKLTQSLSLKFRDYDITSEQWSVLNKLVEQDGITQKELAQRAEKDPTNVTRILDQLERKGLIRREANIEDRRSFLIHATASGQALNQQLSPIEAEFIKVILSALSDEELHDLRKTLMKINDNIEKEREAES